MRCPVTSNNYKEKYTKELTRNGYEVLIITTLEYKDRADNRKCGMGYETSLISKAAKGCDNVRVLHGSWFFDEPSDRLTFGRLQRMTWLIPILV